MRCVLVDGAPRRVDQRPVLEVGFEIAVFRTEHTRPGDTGQRDDVSVVGFAGIPHGILFRIHDGGGINDGTASLFQRLDKIGPLRAVVFLDPQPTAHDQLPIPSPDPVQRRKVRIASLAGEESLSHVVIDDKAHGQEKNSNCSLRKNSR